MAVAAVAALIIRCPIRLWAVPVAVQEVGQAAQADNRAQTLKAAQSQVHLEHQGQPILAAAAAAQAV